MTVIHDCAPKSIEEEIALARQAIQEGDLSHAAFHVTGALAHDPANIEALTYLDALVERADDPVALAPFAHEGPTWFGTFAVRGRILVKLGHVAEGIGYVVRSIEPRPDIPYLRWLDDLLRGGLADPGVVDALVRALRSASMSFPAKLDPSSPLRVNAEIALCWLARVEERFPDHAEASFATIKYLRALGKTKDAVAKAESVDGRRATYMSAITLGASLRDDGRREDALEAYRVAASRAPNADASSATHLDIGDVCVELERYHEAAEAYRGALARNPSEAWAIVRLPFAEYMATYDERAYQALRAIAHGPSCSADADALFRRIAKPVLDWIDRPTDATANSIRQLDQEAFGGNLGFQLSHPEGGSNFAALTLLARAFGHEADATFGFPPKSENDGRDPLPGESIALFVYEDERFRPAFPPASAEVTASIADLAWTRFSLEGWADRASDIGRSLGAAGHHELLGVMANPPEPPNQRVDFPQWVLTVQIAAALAYVGLHDETDSSLGLRVLTALARGPIDWSVTAAIHGLTAIAMRDAKARPAVRAVFQALKDRIPADGGCTYAPALEAAMTATR